MYNLVNQWVFNFLMEVQVKDYLQGATTTQKQVYPWKAQPNMGKGSWKSSALGLSCSMQAAWPAKSLPFPPFKIEYFRAPTPRNCLFFLILLVRGSQESFFSNLPMLSSLYFFPGGNSSIRRTSCSWGKMLCNTLEWSSSRPSTVNITLAVGDWFLTLIFRKKVSTFCFHITAASCPEETSLACPSAQTGTRLVWLRSLFDLFLDLSCVLSCFFHVCNAKPSPLSIHCVCNHVSGDRALSWAERLFRVDVGVIIWREAPSHFHSMTHHWHTEPYEFQLEFCLSYSDTEREGGITIGSLEV